MLDWVLDIGFLNDQVEGPMNRARGGGGTGPSPPLQNHCKHALGWCRCLEQFEHNGYADQGIPERVSALASLSLVQLFAYCALRHETSSSRAMWRGRWRLRLLAFYDFHIQPCSNARSPPPSLVLLPLGLSATP